MQPATTGRSIRARRPRLPTSSCRRGRTRVTRSVACLSGDPATRSASNCRSSSAPKAMVTPRAYDYDMAYDERLAERIRELIAGERGVKEQRMFGGLAFLVGGNMAIAASGQGGILVRVDPEQSDALVASTDAYVMEMRGREMDGWLRVDSEHLGADRELAKWVELGTEYARSLPAKQ